MKRSIALLLATVVLYSCGGTKSATTSRSDASGMTDAQRAEVTYIFFNANKEKLLGNYGTAIDLFGEVVRKDPQNAAAQYELANVYMLQKKYADALFFAKSSYKLDPENIWYARQYAEVLQRNNRFKEAAEIQQQVIRLQPEDEEAYLELAATWIFAEDLDKALSTYSDYEKRFGISEEVSMSKCRIYQQMQQPAKAIAELNKLISTDSSNVQAFGMLAEYYQSIGDSAKALETYKHIEVIDPENAYVHLSLADFYRSAGDKENSFLELKLAFRQMQLDIDTKIRILGSYYNLVEAFPELQPQADELCQLLVQTHPSDPRVYAVQGDFLALQKKWEEARVAYRKARDLGSQEYSVHSQILLLDSQLRDWTSMLSESEESMSLFPDQPFVYYFNGLAKQQVKRCSDAVSVLKTGVKLVVDNTPLEASFYAALGECYHELGDFESSDLSYEKALSLDPEDASALNNYAYFLSLRGDKLTKAEELSKKSLELKPDEPSYEDTYGWILFMKGQYTEAKLWIGKAISHTPEESATLLEHYGDVLYKLGQGNEAMEYWLRAKKAGDGASDKLDQKIEQKKYVE